MAAALKVVPESKPLVLLGLPTEDEREMYDTHLRFEGFRTVLAFNGDDLAEKARALSPHSIVLGQRLHPGGHEVCAMLKSDEATAGIPTVLIASYQIPRGTADAVLVRPVLPPALSETLKLLIKKAGTRL
jgi:DNA-binding response OmpR family regulator